MRSNCNSDPNGASVGNSEMQLRSLMPRLTVRSSCRISRDYRARCYTDHDRPSTTTEDGEVETEAACQQNVRLIDRQTGTSEAAREVAHESKVLFLSSLREVLRATGLVTTAPAETSSNHCYFPYATS
jgi:hypothetical protein